MVCAVAAHQHMCSNTTSTTCLTLVCCAWVTSARGSSNAGLPSTEYARLAPRSATEPQLRPDTASVWSCSSAPRTSRQNAATASWSCSCSQRVLQCVL